MEHGGGEDAGVRRLLRVADVHGLQVALTAHVDHFPTEAGLVLDAREEPQLVRSGLVVAVPAPVGVLLLGRPIPQLVEGALDALASLLLVVEVGDEGDDDELLLGPLRDGLLRLDERLVGDAPAALLIPRGDAGDLLLGRGEEAVDEAEGGKLVEFGDPLLRQLVVASELGDPLGRETEPTQTTDELDDLRTAEQRSEVLTGHGDPPFL